MKLSFADGISVPLPAITIKARREGVMSTSPAGDKFRLTPSLECQYIPL
jgi:hypothetical protein